MCSVHKCNTDDFFLSFCLSFFFSVLKAFQRAACEMCHYCCRHFAFYVVSQKLMLKMLYFAFAFSYNDYIFIVCLFVMFDPIVSRWFKKWIVHVFGNSSCCARLGWFSFSVMVFEVNKQCISNYSFWRSGLLIMLRLLSLSI